MARIDCGQPARVTVLVADDHPLVRFGLQNLLSGQPGVHVIGESASYHETCSAVEKLAPRLVVLDLEMSDSSGIEAVENLRAKYPRLDIIVYTAHHYPWLIVQAIKSGVRGYVLKESAKESLCEAIQAVVRGRIYLDPAITETVTERLVSEQQPENKSESGALTERESIVLHNIAAGRRNREIAAKLCISERTVKYHVASVLTKLRARNRAEAVKIAAAQRLISL